MAEFTITGTAEFDSLVKGVESAMTKVNRSTKKATSGARKLGAGFASAFKKARQSANNAAKAFAKNRLVQVAGLTSIIALTTKSISLFAQQEKAENDLAAALEKTGNFTVRLNNALKEQASALQATSRFGDEAVISGQALLLTYGATADNVQALTEASVELAAATGKSLEESFRQVSKTLGGFSGELGEVIPSLKNLTAEELKAGGAAKLLIEQFGGRAQQDAKSFSGQMQQLANRFGDLLEKIGDAVVNSDLFQKALQFISNAVNDSSVSFTGLTIALDVVFVVLNKIVQAFKLVGAAIGSVIQAFKVLGSAVSFANAKIFGSTRDVILATGELDFANRVLGIQQRKVKQAAIDLFSFEGLANKERRRLREQATRQAERNAQREAQSRINAEQIKRNEIQKTIELQNRANGARAQSFTGVPQGFQFAAGTARVASFVNPETGEVRDIPLQANQAVQGNTIINISAPGVFSADANSLNQVQRLATEGASRGLINNNGAVDGDINNTSGIPQNAAGFR